ncbi:MAG: energy-converting hydrogenase subunit [Methanofollis sp.]|nr:energy-converting hydrogenase subunit [Methanofollis sp.]
MNEYLYEKDLRPLKYHILTGPRQDWTAREMALRLGVRIQSVRSHLIERLDMSDLENMPARFEAGVAAMNGEDPVADALGRDLFVVSIGMFTPEEMEAAYARTRALVDNGMPLDEAIVEGKAALKEVLAP